MSEKPQYVKDSEWEIARALANLWLWGCLVEGDKRLPSVPYTYYVYPRNLALGGPQKMNGKRIVVTIELEDQAQPPLWTSRPIAKAVKEATEPRE